MEESITWPDSRRQLREADSNWDYKVARLTADNRRRSAGWKRHARRRHSRASPLSCWRTWGTQPSRHCERAVRTVTSIPGIGIQKSASVWNQTRINAVQWTANEGLRHMNIAYSSSLSNFRGTWTQYAILPSGTDRHHRRHPEELRSTCSIAGP